MRREYKLTQAQFNELLSQMKPEPVMFLSGGQPMYRSQQDRANDAWDKLGKELGFIGNTVRPVGSDPFKFTAEEKVDE